MKDVLDEIAAGRREREASLAEFYFGTGDVEGLKGSSPSSSRSTRASSPTFPVGDGVDLRVGRYGPYIETSDGKRANVPDDLLPDELNLEKAKELLETPPGAENELGPDPQSGT